MSVAIRMARGGAKKRPYYRIVVTDSRSPRDSKFIEKIGTYNPLLAKDNAERVKIDVERAKHWLGVGAKPSDRVERLMFGLGIINEKTDVSDKPQKTRKRADKESRQEKRAKAEAEAAAAPKQEAAPAAEAPAEAAAETPAEEAPAAEAAE